MRILFAFITITALMQPAISAEYRYYYDGNGNNVGSSMPAGHNTFYYDGQGNNIGSAMKAGKNTFYYDAQGSNVGSSASTRLNEE
jgi:YD repeat-containing protein